MSMPKIEKNENPIDRDQSVSNLIESIALMETGLSHIINAEGEKIQKVVNADAETSIDDMLKVNNSVEKMVSSISKLEMILQNKLDSSKDLCRVDNNSSGAIIPYTGYVDLSTLVDGRAGFGSLVNFAFLPASYARVGLDGDPDVLDIPYNVTAFSNPRDGILTSFSAFLNVTESHSVAPDTQVVARLYMAEPNSTIFKSVKDAIVYLTPKLNPDESTESTGFINDLNVKIPAKSKIVLLFYIYANDNSALYGLCGGGINIK